MISQILFLIGGLMLLVKGADYLVDGSKDIAVRFGVPTLVIGLTIVAFGTSAPELVVNILAAAEGNADIALGNVNGSNIANILLILGAAAIITHIPVRSRTVFKEIPFLILSGIMLIVFLLDPLLNDGTRFALSQTDGIALLGYFAIFMFYLIMTAKSVKPDRKKQKSSHSLPVAAVITIGGLAGLIIGAWLTVNSATELARGFGVSEGLIAVSLVAVGTSLPELVSSIVAARKGEMDLAVGGIVGSNIFNILMVVGVTATISPRPLVVEASVVWDSVFALGAMIVLFFAIYFDQYRRDRFTSTGISRIEGAGFLVLYAAYIAYIIIRG